MSIKAAENFTVPFKRKIIIRGAAWFAGITVLTLAAIFFYHNTGNALSALSNIKPAYIIVCLCMLLFDLLLGGWRNHIFIRKLKPGISQWASFKANAANMFMGAITPAHSGAGPAQIYIYMRSGLDFLSAFTVALINMASTLIFMPVAALISILLIDHQFEDGIIPGLLKYGFSFFFLFLLVFLLAFRKPVLAGNMIRQLAAWLARLIPSKRDRLLNWGNKTFTSIEKYQYTCSILLKEHPMLFPLSLLLTFLLYMNKYCMQYVILLGLGIHADIVQVISIQIIIQFMIYFAPSPGGSGFAELGISVLFAKIVPAAVIPAFTLLQRCFLLFFPAVVGACVVLGRLKKEI